MNVEFGKVAIVRYCRNLDGYFNAPSVQAPCTYLNLVSWDRYAVNANETNVGKGEVCAVSGVKEK